MKNINNIQNIEELNLITDILQVKPNYSLENITTSIEVYFNDKGQVLIIGVVDNNYIYWGSLTDSNDKEINRAIFDYISQGQIKKVCHFYKVVETAGFDYNEVKRWVKIRLTRKSGEPMYWITPFEGNYAASQVQHNGNFFARDIAGYMKSIHDKCRFREADGAYEKVLDYYLAVLKEDDGNPLYYFKVKNIFEIIQSESYLYGSESSAIREKYCEIVEKLEGLYNRYMSAAR